MECGRMTVKNTCQTDGTRYVPDVNVLEFWALVLDQVCKY